MADIGRKPRILKLLLGKLDENGLLNKNIVLGIKDWQKAWRESNLAPNAKTKEEAISRTELLMRGLDNPRKLAEDWVNGDHSEPDSEVGLRARLSDEMALCLRKDGVILPDGKVESDVACAVETVIYELKPELKDEVDAELSREKLGRIIDLEPGRTL